MRLFKNNNNRCCSRVLIKKSKNKKYINKHLKFYVFTATKNTDFKLAHEYKNLIKHSI